MDLGSLLYCLLVLTVDLRKEQRRLPTANRPATYLSLNTCQNS